MQRVGHKYLNHLIQLTTSYTSYLLFLQIKDNLLKFLSAICIRTYNSGILEALLKLIAKHYIKLRQVFFYLPRLNSTSNLKQLFPESQSSVIVPVYWPATRRNLFLKLLTSIFWSCGTQTFFCNVHEIKHTHLVSAMKWTRDINLQCEVHNENNIIGGVIKGGGEASDVAALGGRIEGLIKWA